MPSFTHSSQQVADSQKSQSASRSALRKLSCLLICVLPVACTLSPGIDLPARGGDGDSGNGTGTGGSGTDGSPNPGQGGAAPCLEEVSEQSFRKNLGGASNENLAHSAGAAGAEVQNSPAAAPCSPVR